MSEPFEIFQKLECNDTEIIENARIEIYNLLKSVKDSWVVNGLYDYYLNSDSLRSMEILANVNEIHFKYLFDKLTESIRRQETEIKVKALTLLGHIVRKQPTWIFKINEHPILREILSLLKNEDDILALISALLLVIVLMPMIPSLIAHHLQDIFEIFSRLAAWNLGTGPHFDKSMMIHMQISLYALFLRLYGMYPCNFVAYIRSFYRNKNNPVFIHTIQPMLETVRMHPRLVTSTKDNEISNERWKTLGAQQVIAECEQFYVDVIDKCPHDCCYVSTGFRSRSNTTTSSTAEYSKFQIDKLKELCVLTPREETPFFTPSFGFPSAPADILTTRYGQITTITTTTIGQEGTSPPEAAIEATPETTPVRDSMRGNVVRVPHIGSSVVRGLSSFTTKNRSANTTPTHSQPSSPMKKESSPFHFPSAGNAGNIKRDSITHQRLQKMLLERSQSVEVYVDSSTMPGVAPLIVPSSPVKIISSDSNRGVAVKSMSSAHENEDVKSTVSTTTPNSCQNFDIVPHEHTTSDCEELDTQLEQGSPCSQGGLHMPNSKSMNEFAKRVQRLRYHSQNNDIDHSGDSTGSSPGKEISKHLENSTVRRANSCPDMKKKSPIAGKKPLKVTDEEETDESGSLESKRKMSSKETQTEDGYMPYEHLFLNIFPCLGGNEVKPSPSPSSMPVKPFGEKENHHSVYNVLDRYMEISKGEVLNPYIQIQLLQHQLLFERYRRETFSARNRKLLADAKNAKSLEEYNSALKDTIRVQQKEIDHWNERFKDNNMENTEEQKKTRTHIQSLEQKLKTLQNQLLKLESEKDKQYHNFSELSEKYRIVDDERQRVSSALFEAYAQLNIAKEQAAMGERARAEVERLNKEILLLGELQLKYQEKSVDLIQKDLIDAQHKMIENAYKEELKILKNKLDSTKSLVEMYRQRIADLESVVAQREEGIGQLKRNLLETNMENHEKIKAVECRYKSQLAINRALEQKMLQLFARIELPGFRNLHSPETSSCHEAIATPSVSGHSPHSSPLSISLASSGSSTANFLNADMKNLQILVEKKTGKLEDSVESAGDTIEILQRDQLLQSSASTSSYQND